MPVRDDQARAGSFEENLPPHAGSLDNSDFAKNGALGAMTGGIVAPIKDMFKAIASIIFSKNKNSLT